jgi:rhodanese-related sulfurtransferase
LAADIAAERDHISATVLGERLMRGESSLLVFDLRSAAEFAELHIPSATRIAVEDLGHAPLPRSATIVVYSEGGAHAAQAWMLLRLRGYRRVFFLREGLYEWIARVLEPRLAVDATVAERAEFDRAAALSRFFGGVPRAGVPRAEVPIGYWTGGQHGSDGPADRTSQVVATIRRRGC